MGFRSCGCAISVRINVDINKGLHAYMNVTPYMKKMKKIFSSQRVKIIHAILVIVFWDASLAVGHGALNMCNTSAFFPQQQGFIYEKDIEMDDNMFLEVDDNIGYFSFMANDKEPMEFQPDARPELPAALVGPEPHIPGVPDPVAPVYGPDVFGGQVATF
ncbi:hypothetical protein ACJX0J_028606, partial [Zea mays]